MYIAPYSGPQTSDLPNGIEMGIFQEKILETATKCFDLLTSSPFPQTFVLFCLQIKQSEHLQFAT